MPKLFRLTSNNPSGLVDVNFKEDININPESKIALKNASFSVDDTIFEVTPTNGQMTYVQATGAVPQVIDLDVGNYSRTNAHALLQDIRDKLNEKMNQTSATLGTQWEVSQEGGNTLIEQRICPNERSLFINFLQPPRGEFDNVTIDAGFANELNINGDAYVTDDSQNIKSYASLSKGIGVFRTRIQKLNTYATDPNSNGFIMGLSEVNPRAWAPQVNGEFDINDLTYYINVRDPSQAQPITSKDKGAGGEVDTGEALQTTSNNADAGENSIDIRVQNGQVVFDLFKLDDANATNLATFTLSNKRQKLFPFLIFRGAAASMNLQAIKLTVDPFENDLSGYLNRVIPTPAESLGIQPIPISPAIGALGRTLSFQDGDITKLLGFFSNPIKNENVYKGQYRAESPGVYELAIQNPFFIIRLLNIDVSSYDAEYGSRYNVLATIGPTNSAESADESVYYEASELLYLDIRNSSPRSLRNIKLQVLNADLSKPRLDGLTSITLVVD